jgi:hypothetical protein
MRGHLWWERHNKKGDKLYLLSYALNMFVVHRDENYSDFHNNDFSA